MVSAVRVACSFKLRRVTSRLSPTGMPGKLGVTKAQQRSKLGPSTSPGSWL